MKIGDKVTILRKSNKWSGESHIKNCIGKVGIIYSHLFSNEYQVAQKVSNGTPVKNYYGIFKEEELELYNHT